MTRTELIAKVAEHFPEVPAGDTQAAVETLLAAIAQALAEGGRVEIRGFGSFSVQRRAGRLGRNPATGAAVSVRPKAVPHFKPGSILRDRVAGPA
jgi:integration host factor subunit beta